MSFDILQWLEDSPLKLVRGKGSPETGGCWMSALSKYSNESWSDHPDCVCPVIRELCVSVNDMLPDDASRGRVIGPHILEPVGTRTDDKSVIEKRRWLLVDAAVRQFAPAALYASGMRKEAAKLRQLPAVSADNAAHAAACVDATDAHVAAHAAACAASACARAAYFAASARLNDAAQDAVGAAVEAARAADASTREKFASEFVMPVIMQMCSIGSKVPQEMACGVTEFKTAVGCN